MALYLGIDKVQICIDDILYKLNFYSTAPIVSGDILLSLDNHVLKDSNGLYLTAKKEGE
jgi:hypothetical protein